MSGLGNQDLGLRLELLRDYRMRTISLLEALDLEAVAAVVRCLDNARQRGSSILLAGNGGSAATASHFANDLTKATRVEGSPDFRAISISDNLSLLSALANDDGYETVFCRQVESLCRQGDVFIAISASGESPNLVSATLQAQKLGGETIGLVGFSGGTIADIADLVVHTPCKVGDYGPVEDVHLVLVHMITEYLRQGPNGTSNINSFESVAR